jgi:hypothetical protein
VSGLPGDTIVQDLVTKIVTDTRNASEWSGYVAAMDVRIAEAEAEAMRRIAPKASQRLIFLDKSKYDG